VQEQELRVGVYRRLDNRPAQPDDSEFAWDLHRRRRRALEDAFADGDGVAVLDWGGTCDEERTHELVELVIAAGGLAVKYVVIPGAKRLADKLVEVGVEMSVTEAVKALFSRLQPKQEAREILDFHITLPDGTYIDVQPPDLGSKVTITTQGGRVEISREQQTA
jgi:hypothetical protein